ncbi:hypothetical protein HKX48_008033 [Thoreauomyces humboldtii]|nr:hypothetical protein HKX48_008033 [Thoreauomyces humboldtii]
MSVRQLVYTSDAAPYLGPEDHLDILSSARSYNAVHDITGMLLHAASTFIQVLEGPSDEIEEVYLRISRDPRHTRPVILLDALTHQRDFECWMMGYRDAEGPAVDDDGDVVEMEFLTRVRNPSPVVKLLADFVRQHMDEREWDAMLTRSGSSSSTFQSKDVLYSTA